MPDSRDPSKVGIAVYISRELRDAVKVRLHERGDTLTGIITRALEEYRK